MIQLLAKLILCENKSQLRDFSYLEHIFGLDILLASEIFCMGLVYRDPVIALGFVLFKPQVKHICNQKWQEMNKERKAFCKQFLFSPHIVLKKGNDVWNTDINTWIKS